ncbi:hypothetical protein M2165_004589 [Variovorax sp. TBS-050B]|uniref:hypothetical protein n=1 Tax=Variovorax sp. TBS-050B TaxID=2940551 RepID=UPI0024769F14|nr:hypothetical protein [Variovorax sp. TBS-050B]MDH6594700.1 hypothetical protein [Variovorax sp. TBS-050B]
MPKSSDARTVAKLAWEAAWERLDNALQPPPGYPAPTPEELHECFRLAQERLDHLRLAHALLAEADKTTDAAAQTPKTGYFPELGSGHKQ